MTKLVTCTKCGWVHMAVTRAHAEAEVARFNAYYVTLSAEERGHFGSPSSIAKDYEGCGLCAGTEFRPAQPGDCPDGCTIGPVIWESTEPTDIVK